MKKILEYHTFVYVNIQFVFIMLKWSRLWLQFFENTSFKLWFIQFLNLVFIKFGFSCSR